jgi:PAS domain S-box-containing protein
VDGTLASTFKELVDGSPAILYVARPDGGVSYANAAWERFSGLPVEAVLEHGWTDVIHPEDRGWVGTRWLEAMAETTPFREEFRIVDVAGTARWVGARAQPSCDEGGMVVAWYGTVVDIDDRRRADRRRAVLDRLGAAFAESLDFERTARTVVRALCEDFADFAFVDVYGPAGQLDRIAVESGRLSSDPAPFFRFVPPPHAQHPINTSLVAGSPRIFHAVDDAWRRSTTWSDEHLAFLQTLPIDSIAYVPMLAAGKRIGVLTFGSAIGSGRRFTAADVEDAEEIARRAAVALANARLYRDLAASEARYRGVVETAQEGVWIVDRKARTRYVNARLSELLGYDADAMYDRPAFDFISPSHVAAVREAFARLRDGAAVRDEVELVRSDGSLATVVLAAGPTPDAAGAFAGALMMVTDVTERRRAADAMVRLARTREIVNRAAGVLSASLDLDALLGRFAEVSSTSWPTRRRSA